MNLPNDLPMIDFDKTELRLTATARIVRHRDGLFSATPLGRGLSPYYLVVLSWCAPVKVDVYANPVPLGSSAYVAPELTWADLVDQLVELGYWVEFNPASAEEWRRIYDGAGGIRQSAGPAFRIDEEMLDALLDEALSATAHRPV